MPGMWTYDAESNNVVFGQSANDNLVMFGIGALVLIFALNRKKVLYNGQ